MLAAVGKLVVRHRELEKFGIADPGQPTCDFRGVTGARHAFVEAAACTRWCRMRSFPSARPVATRGQVRPHERTSWR